MNKEFNVIDGETLLDTEFAPIEFIVEKLIAPGLHILSGAPKMGKSWLAFWLCLQVSKGEPVWNFKTKQGTTLYLGLEDSIPRLQDRLSYMTYDAAKDLFVATVAENIGTGIEEQIRNFVANHPGTNLIVIDTFQRIRSISNDNAYAVDYKDIGFLKQIADELKIAIILVHHLRKEKHEDPVAMVSGTSGITGAADTILVLDKSKRSSNNATLCCVGRDIEYREIELHFDKPTKVWEFVKDSVENPEILLENIVADVVEFIKDKHSFVGTPSELAELLLGYCKEKIVPSVLSRELNKNKRELAEQGIRYEKKRSNGKRLIFLSAVPQSQNDVAVNSADSDGNSYIPITVPADPVGKSE